MQQLNPASPAPSCMVLVQDTRSYYDQCQALKGCSDRSIYDKPFPKPSVEASFHGPTAYSVPGVPVALCSVQRPILSVYPFSMSPGKADFVSFCDTAANRFWIALQHTIALVSWELGSPCAGQCMCPAGSAWLSQPLRPRSTVAWFKAATAGTAHRQLCSSRHPNVVMG
jgi:hypothetical protein